MVAMLAARSASLPLQRLQACDRARLAVQLQDVQAGIDAIREINIAAVVGLRIVALDHGVAATLLAQDHSAARLRRLGDRRDEITDLPGLIGVADVEHADAGIEEGDEGQLLVERRPEVLIGGMRAEAPAARAEITARLRNRPMRYHHRLGLDGVVHKEDHLATLS